MCRKKLRETKGKVHEVNTESDLETEQPGKHYDFFVDSIDYDKKQSQAYAKIALGPKSKIISMKLDSGSQVNIVPKSIFRSLGVSVPLQKTNKRLTAYDRKPLKVDGYIKLQCLHNGRKTTEDFYIVDTNSSPILALDTCLYLDLIKFVLTVESDATLCRPYDKENVLQKYGDVFDGIGQLPGECEIYLKPDATPVVHPPRRVPVALRDKLKAELDRMEREQIITKQSQPTD